jgi:hypothetical protein
MLRLLPELIDEVRALAPINRAVEDGLRLWLARQKRRQRGKVDPLAKHLAPPTAREITAEEEPAA